MFEKLEGTEKKYEELTEQLVDPQLLADQPRYTRATKQHRDLEEVVAKYREYKALQRAITETREMLATEADSEMIEMARGELAVLEARRDQAEKDLKVLLIPKDPNNEKNVSLEIRASTG